MHVEFELAAVAHDIRSAHNVGSIYRTADGAGFTRIVLAGITPGAEHSGVAKVALGAETALPTERVEDDNALLAWLEGWHVVCLEQTAESIPPSNIVIPSSTKRICLIAGGELFGLPESIVERADTVVELPMRGEKESLNVSVAFGIAAYAVANATLGSGVDALRSRAAARPVRPGVLTLGPTIGEERTRTPFVD